MRPSKPRLLVALALPFLAAPWVARALADAAADDAVIDLVEAADSLRPVPPPPELPLTGDLGIGDEAPIILPYFEPPRRAGRSSPPAAGAGPRVTPRGGVVIRSSAILRAAEAGARPTGTPVAPSGRRPAGMALAGVSHHDAGLRDGDVLTEIAGVAATSEGAVVGAIAGAVNARARVITGTVWRRDQPLSLVVEIPEIERPKPKKKKGSAGDQAAEPSSGGEQR